MTVPKKTQTYICLKPQDLFDFVTERRKKSVLLLAIWLNWEYQTHDHVGFGHYNDLDEGCNFGEESRNDLDFGDDDTNQKKFCYCPKRAVNAQLAQAKGDSEALNPTRLKGIHRKH